MEKHLYDRILDSAGPSVISDCKLIYREVVEGHNGVLLTSGRYINPLRARIVAVTDMNRYPHRGAYLVTRDGDDLLLLKTSRLTKSGRYVGAKDYLTAPLYRRPIVAPIATPGPRSRLSPLATRLAA